MKNEVLLGEKKGLNLFPRTQIDAQVINERLNEAGLTFEWNAEFGCFFLPEEEDCHDALESQIDDELSGCKVNYSIEGVF